MGGIISYFFPSTEIQVADGDVTKEGTEKAEEPQEETILIPESATAPAKNDPGDVTKEVTEKAEEPQEETILIPESATASAKNDPGDFEVLTSSPGSLQYP